VGFVNLKGHDKPWMKGRVRSMNLHLGKALLWQMWLTLMSSTKMKDQNVK
jgi:hypothetical protein